MHLYTFYIVVKFQAPGYNTFGDVNFFSSPDRQKAMHMSPPCICTGGLKNDPLVISKDGRFQLRSRSQAWSWLHFLYFWSRSRNQSQLFFLLLMNGQWWALNLNLIAPITMSGVPRHLSKKLQKKFGHTRLLSWAPWLADYWLSFANYMYWKLMYKNQVHINYK